MIFLLNLEIGYLTPPVGLNLFISSFRFNKPVTQLYRAVLPFIGLLGLALIMITYIPSLSTWIPSMIQTTAVDLDAPVDEEEQGEGTGLDVEQIEDGDAGFDLDDLETDEPLDLDALEEEETEQEVDLDALEAQDEQPQEEQP
jgi:hypothetical protein